MTDPSPHRGRSPEFLSRWHDGDLSAGERAWFETHCAHCAECRTAAADFESALSLYRSSRPGPPAADLSARILRKLRASTPKRSPFGVTFGIDLRWAGAFAAALICALIGFSVVERREAEEHRIAAESAPIPVVIQRDGRPEEKPSNKPAAAAAQEAGAVTRRQAIEPEPRAEGRPRAVQPAPESDLKSAPAAAAQPAVPVDSLQKEESSRNAERMASSAAPPQTRNLSRPAAARKNDSSGGSPGNREAGGEGAPRAKSALDFVFVRRRLAVAPMDEGPGVPELLNGAQVKIPDELLGHEFRLVVEASGHVREVTRIDPEPAGQKPARNLPRTTEAAAAAPSAQESLKSLLFRPSDRPRVLRVKVE